MTWLGWKDVLLRVWSGVFEDRLMSVAASIAFFTLLSVAPAVSVLVSLYGLFVSPSEVFRQVGALSAYLPEAARSIIGDQALRVTSKPAATLSFNLVISFALAAWSANAAIKALFDGLNVIYDEAEKRSFLTFNAISLLTTFGAIALLILALFVIAVLPGLAGVGPLGAGFDWLIAALRWPAFFAIAVAAIVFLYWIGPSRRPARWPWVLPGAALAALLWVGMSSAFSWYVTTLSDYTAAYGSLATVVVFMTWLWLSATVVLLGAELNAELERQTAQDTTLGPPKPIGARGAAVADSVGPPRARE